MRILLRVLLITIFPSLALAATNSPSGSPALTPSLLREARLDKKAILERLKTIKSKHLSETQNLDSAIRHSLQESMRLGLTGDSLRIADQRAHQMTAQISELRRKKEEASARREILDRLIFIVDTKYSSQPLQTFLEQQFLEMANKDLSDGRDERLWKVLTYLSICAREVPEPRENVLDVIEGYLEFTSVLDPKTPAEFMANRSYTNGVQSEAASRLSLEEAGDKIQTAATNDLDGSKSGSTNAMPAAPEKN